MQNRIVVVTGTHLSGDSRTYKQVLSLISRGYQCVVIQSEQGSLNPASVPFTLYTVPRFHDLQKPKEPSRITSHPQTSKKRRSLKQLLPPKLRYLFPFGRYLFRLLKYNIALWWKLPKASLYYLHYFDSAPAVCWAARRAKAPVIYDAHDCHVKVKPDIDLNERERLLIKPLHRKLEAYCISKAKTVITVCEGVAQLQKELFGCEAKVIRNCHDCRLDRYMGPGIKQKIGIASDHFLVVVVGAAKKGMAFEPIFEALLQLPEQVHVAFLGNGYQPFLQGYAYQAVHRRVHPVSAVKPYEVVPFIRDGDAALLTYYEISENHRYSLPNRFFQSLSAELPLLYPALPEMARLAEHYSLGLPVDPLQATSLIKGIQHLFEQHVDYQRFKNNCKTASEALSWKNEEVRFHEAIEQTLYTNAFKS